MNEERTRILYVEDDEVLGFVTRDNLEINGYSIVHCDTGRKALSQFKKSTFDLCILDVMLPEMDGFELAREIRKRSESIPIIFLTAKSMKEDKLYGLRLGGDDYMTKPFSIEELILKIEVFLKRRHIALDGRPTSYELGDYEFDYGNLMLTHNGETRNLTQKEGELLQLLIEHKNNIIKRRDILERLWGQDDYFMGRSLDVFISRLRKYLGGDPTLRIENIHGVGFRLVRIT